MNPAYVVPVLGALSFLTPCMWNLNLILRAHVKEKGWAQVVLLVVSRLFLLNLIALPLHFLRIHFSLPTESVAIVQSTIAFVFIIGFPLMKRLGKAPFDLSPQFLFPSLRLPPGVSLGLSLPYCSIPFILLLVAYSLSFSDPFVLFNIYAVTVSIPALLLLVLPERWVRAFGGLVPAVPPATGFFLLLSLGLLLDLRGFNLYIFSLLEEEHSVLFLIPVMFLLGFLTSLGPSTLPFLPVVFGILITKQRERGGVLLGVIGFLLSFIVAHAFVGAVASLGSFILTDLFRVDLFNLILSIALFLVALNLLNLLPFEFEISRLNPFKGTVTGSFTLGLAYTFSLCPSCTSLLLGALVLSASTQSPVTASLLMGLYAIGRSIPVFLSGMVARNLSDILKGKHTYVNRAVAFLFLLLSIYFFKNFLEVRL